jgi:environmental stress-induced protein Ves
MPIIRVAEQVVTPWKNGGGTTRAVAVHPPGASLDDFLWRISIATVGADGPFSAFLGVDRLLMLLDGDGMALVSDSGELRLSEVGQVASFPGEQAITGRLLGGPTVDLNVMTRRGAFSGALSLRHVAAPFTLAHALVAIDGALRADGHPLEAGDAVVGPAAIDGVGRAALITLQPS